MRASRAAEWLILLLACGSLAARCSGDDAVKVVVHADERGKKINPFIYGQFIEHLGRCIYGGIWAEMLEDRKFYFPITANYDPYKSLEDTAFPVVGASPWEIVGSGDSVEMTTERPFVGEHTPRVAGGSGLRQHDLGVVSGKEYRGYIWVRGAEDKPASIEVSLRCGEEDEDAQSHRFSEIGGEYKKHSFEFTADADSNETTFEIRVADGAAVLVGTASLMPADNVNGMRADTLALLKQLDAPMYRWPGGNFVSGYDWRDGIGNRDRRPPRKNPAWTGVEHNDVGIDEFIAFCREVAAEPLIAVNTGFGDDYSAAQEVEYCNGAPSTIGGGWRAKNGHAEPYNVKYWCVGNEMFGDWQLGYMKLEHYTQKHNRVARAMLHADPSLKLIAVGDLGPVKGGWTEGMLRECRDHMDYVSEHFYRGRTPWGEQPPADVAEHVALLRDEIRKKASGHRQLQAELGHSDDQIVPIAMDEWNYWHREYVYGELGCSYDLADALGVAAGLHEYYRQSDLIHMAHYAQTVNVIGCIKTTKTQAFLDTTALPLMLYRKHFGDTPLRVTCEAPEKRIDVAAALADDGKTLTLAAVNPSGQPSVLKVELLGGEARGDARQWVVTAEDPRLTNDAEHARVAPVESGVDFHGSWEVPGFSFAILRVPL